MGHAAIIKYDMLADSVRFQVGKIFGRGSTSCRTWNVGVNSSVKRRNAASRSSARSSSRMEEASWHDIRSDILCDLCILMHTYATCFNILQVSSRSCPIFGVEDMDVVSYCRASHTGDAGRGRGRERERGMSSELANMTC